MCFYITFAHFTASNNVLCRKINFMQLATCIHTYPNGVHQVSKQDTHCGTINTLYNCLNGCDFYTAIYEGTKPKLHGS